MYGEDDVRWARRLETRIGVNKYKISLFSWFENPFLSDQLSHLLKQSLNFH